jgi:histidinol-phosphatase (PHP family)
MQKFTYHSHTNFSDGSDTLEDMLQQAVKLGWKEIGISDHLIVHKNMKQSPVYPYLLQNKASYIYRSSFSKCKEEFMKRSESFRQTARRYPIKVYLGYEVDYFTYDGWEEEFRDFIKDIDHDYLITGNHFFQTQDQLLLDTASYDQIIDNDSAQIVQQFLRVHYETIAKAVRSGLFVFLAHLDFARRLKQHALYPMWKERFEVVRALKETGMACELSTKGLRKIGDFYPERPLLEEMIKQNVPIVISDDAHKTSELGYDFDKGEAALQELNCQNRFHLNLCS